jgi:hypothetical protein
MHGKGAKERLVPVTRELMIELSTIPTHLGLSVLCSRSEDTPLVLPIGATKIGY